MVYEVPYARNSGPVKCYIDSNGELYTWGFDVYQFGKDDVGNYSSLGQGDGVIYNNVPTSIYSGVKQITMTRAVTENNEMVEWGFTADKKATIPKIMRKDVSYIHNDYYITGSGDFYSYVTLDESANKYDSETSDKLIDTEIICIADVVFGTGGNNQGIIGFKKDGTVWKYSSNNGGNGLRKKVKVIEGVTQLFSGYRTFGTVFFLKEDGSLWSYGNNEFGQCGNGEKGDLNTGTKDCVVSEPFKVLDNVKNVYYSRWRAAYAVTENGDLYGWGCNDCDLFLQGGEKTMYSDATHAVCTTPVLIMSGVKEVIYSGNFNTACLAIKEDNSLWTWGTNLYGELGNGTLPETEDLSPGMLQIKLSAGDVEFFEPVKILDGVKRYVGCQDYMQFVEMTDGRIMYWGLDYIVTDEEDDWDFQSSWNDLLYEKHYIIPTPIEFSVDTYFQTALDYIAAQSGVDVSQYQAVRYIGK